jgi:hypothetical protein
MVVSSMTCAKVSASTERKSVALQPKKLIKQSRKGMGLIGYCLYLCAKVVFFFEMSKFILGNNTVEYMFVGKFAFRSDL